MGQMTRQIGPNETRYYWYPGDRKEWLRALLALLAGGAALGVAYLLTRSWLVSTVMGLSVASGVFGYNLGRRDLAAAEALNARTPRREAASAAGRAGWRGIAEGAAAAFAALIVVHLPATGFVADWLLPLVPAVVGGLSRQTALVTMRLSRQSEGLDATRQVEDDEDQDVPQDVSSEEPTRTL
jgi:uncharacterized membrane protein